MSVVLTNLHCTGLKAPSGEHWGGDLSPTPCRRRRFLISQLLGPKRFPGNSLSLFTFHGSSLECGCFTRLCWFLPYGRVNSSIFAYIYMHPRLLGFPSHTGHRALSRADCPIRRCSFVYFIHNIKSVWVSVPTSQFIPSPPSFPPWCP